MEIYKAAAEALRGGQKVWMVAVVKATGSVPRGEGAELFVFEDGSPLGTVGGGLVEYEAIEKAKARFRDGDDLSFTEVFKMNNKDAAAKGMVCGGNVTLFYQALWGEDAAACLVRAAEAVEGDQDAWLAIAVRDGVSRGALAVFGKDGIRAACGDFPTGAETEAELGGRLLPKAVLDKGLYTEPLATQGRVVVFGGGHVGQALVPILRMTGFRTVVFEDRPEFCSRALFPEPTELCLGDFSRVDASLELKPGDYCVLMTRGHAADMAVLEQLLRKKLRYIGMMGSKRKIIAVYEHLRKEGFTDDDFGKVHAPVGLAIGSETPEEIAVSIAAQLIGVKRGVLE